MVLISSDKSSPINQTFMGNSGIYSMFFAVLFLALAQNFVAIW